VDDADLGKRDTVFDVEVADEELMTLEGRGRLRPLNSDRGPEQNDHEQELYADLPLRHLIPFKRRVSRVQWARAAPRDREPRDPDLLHTVLHQKSVAGCGHRDPTSATS